MSKMERLTQKTSINQSAVSKNRKGARVDRKAWKNKLQRKQRRHKM
jgi:hypothetical protein